MAFSGFFIRFDAVVFHDELLAAVLVKPEKHLAVNFADEVSVIVLLARRPDIEGMRITVPYGERNTGIRLFFRSSRDIARRPFPHPSILHLPLKRCSCARGFHSP